jgi:uridine kinase
VDALVNRIRAIRPSGAAAMVAIDGWGCGGKTALAGALLDRLEPEVQYLGTDEFFAGFDVVEPGPVSHLRWSELTDAIHSLKLTGTASVRSFDWDRLAVGPPVPLAGRAWIVEGLYGLRPEFRDLYDLRIWVQGRLDNRLDRVTARDGAHNIPFWEREWMPRERAYMAAERPWSIADIIVAGADADIGAIGQILRTSV